jgi:hypothetical protein
VTVWRELRRLGDQRLTDKRMDAVLAAADVGDWAAYTQLQGGHWLRAVIWLFVWPMKSLSRVTSTRKMFSVCRVSIRLYS